MKNDVIDKANKFENEMRKEARQINPEMKVHVAAEKAKGGYKAEDTWENVKTSVASTAGAVKEKTELTISKTDSKLDRMAKEKEAKVEAELWEKKVQFDLFDD